MTPHLLIALAAALAPPMQAAPLAAAPVAAPVHASDLDRLVLLMLPEQRVIDLTLVAVRKQALLRPDFAKDPEMADFVIKRMWPEVEKTLRDGLPELRAELAKVIAASLTPAEVSDLYAFFSSPTGQKLQNVMFEVIAENPSASPAEQQRLMMDKFMPSLTPDDYGALTRFGGSGAAHKMQDITPRISTVSEAWAADILSRNDARMTVLRNQAIADYKRQKEK